MDRFLGATLTFPHQGAVLTGEANPGVPGWASLSFQNGSIWRSKSSTVTKHRLTDDDRGVRLTHARETASLLQARIRGRENVPIRRSFIAGGRGAEEAPPLARLLRSGRGAGVRLRLYLSLLWVAVAEPHDVTLPARTWARLLGLRDPEGAGARQVRSGLSWLEANTFVRVDEVPGHPSCVTLLDETGSGEDYTLPAVAFKRAEMAGVSPDPHIYVRLPAAYWICGWAAHLSGAATAMLLVLLEARGGRSSDKELWFSPSVADARYTLSENTRAAGVRELAQSGLVVVHRRPVDPAALSYRRVRNTYTLFLDNLSTPAHSDAASES